MKKIAVILLLALFFFNLFGYRILFYYAQLRADQKLEKTLDRSAYNENELVALTIPISMPYQHSSNGFERFDGEITLQGKIYKFVKRKYGDDKITYLCLPDHEKTLLQTAKDNFAAKDIAGGETKKNESSKMNRGKIFSAEYCQNVSHHTLALHAGSEVPAFLSGTYPLISVVLALPEQPPEMS